MNQDNINVCLIQLNVIPYNFEENKKKIEKYVDKVMNLHQKPDIIVLPEMWNIGFTINKVNEYCDRDGKQTKLFLNYLAKKYHIIIIGGSIANFDTKNNIYQNLNMNFDSNGQLLSSYAKIHLFSPSKENTVFTRGHQFKVISTNINKTFINNNEIEKNNNSKLTLETNSNLIFHNEEIRFEGGLDILFVSAAWPYPRLNHWRNLLIARAIENQCYVVAVNNCGEMDGLTFCGHSLVIDPWGEVLIEGRELEGKDFDEILITSLSFKVLKDIRQRICVFNDRFPEIYRCN
ncbi:cyanide hydratase [Anaeromyces robustus]|uniref:Cyanide hydratase n=1 Tax=Anaeromyces robustus TaxID=1754192 RepID=A0A1Y1WQX9_9FUNG|nr:cyanide hydratase [Anaeromyces robustus]|eukprot:ORX75676.1 cyanide hydratase [Anaeromyces robustus]